MNLSAEEIIIIVILALVVIGPQRLPEYAEQLGKLVRNVRKMATGATETIREELGDEIADLDLTKFDPRQYDPRRIVREALLDDVIPATKPVKPKTPTTRTPAATPKPRTTAKASAAKTSTEKAVTATAAAGSSDVVVEDAPVATDASPDESAVVADESATAEVAAAATPQEDAGEPEMAMASAAVLPPFDDEAT